MRRHRIAGIIAVAGVLTQLAGCGTSEGDGGSGPGPNPAIAITITPTALTVVQGGNGSISATITRSGGFSGAVTIASQGAPAGVTATPSNGTTTNGVTTGTVTIVVGAATAPGSYPILVRASGNGVSTVETTFTLTVTAAPAFGLTLAPATLSVAQGTSGNVQVNLIRTNLQAAIDLAAAGLPTGVAVAFVPASVTGTSATATFTVGGGAPVGSHQVTISGAATGAAAQNAILTLTITAAAPAQDFGLRVAPTGPLSLAQGAAGQAVVNVDRTGGFAGTVNLAVTGAPAGLGTALASAATTGNAVNLDLTAAANLAPGSYTLTVTGSATALPNRTANLVVNVTAVTGGPIAIDFTGCEVAERPIWLAVQDGAGAPWNQVAPTSHRYSFTVAQTKAGLAYVVDEGFGLGVHATTVMYLSRDELAAYAAAGPCRTGKTVSGTITNTGVGLVGGVSLGGAFAPAVPQSGSTASFTLMGVAAGSHDLLAYLGAIGSPQTGDRIGIRRDQDVPGGGSLAPFDATGAETVAPATAIFTVGNLNGGETVDHGMGYRTGSACTAASFYNSTTAPGTTFTGFGVPGSAQRASDYHVVDASARTAGAMETRTVWHAFRSMGPRTLTLPPSLPAPTITDVSTTFKRLQFSYVQPGNYDGTATVSYASATKRIAMTVSILGYIGASAVNLTTPDFSAGYDPAWGPTPASTVDWSIAAVGTNNLAACVEGAETWTASRRGTL